MNRIRMNIGFGLALFSLALTSQSPAAEPRPLVVVVMDPLSAKLACDCVKGYAQRKYERLGSYLKETLHRQVSVVYSESLVTALRDETQGEVDLVIGKHSVVLADATAAGVQLSPQVSLTGTDGKTTQTGLIVVRRNDPARAVADLKGYRILFGPVECDEKSAAPAELLRRAGVELPAELETSETCSTAASTLLEFPETTKGAAVISSYAEPLLAGCGTIQEGDLRVVGTSREVPFITGFVNKSLSEPEQQALRSALLQVGKHSELLLALETKTGFVAWSPPADAPASGKKK